MVETIFSFKEELIKKSKFAILISFLWIFAILLIISLFLYLVIGPLGPSIFLPLISFFVLSMFAPHLFIRNSLFASMASVLLIMTGVFLWPLFLDFNLIFFYFLPSWLAVLTLPLFYLGISIYPLTYYSYKKPDRIIDALLKTREPNLYDPKEKLAVDVFENLKLAFGIQNVKLKILPWEIINAMAVSSKQYNCIYLTEGAIEKLDYYELEGVLAHEFSHIKNRDSYYMTLVTIVAGLAILFAWFLAFELPKILFKGEDREEKSSVIVAIAIASFVIGIILYLLTPFIMTKIYSYLSKKREILADITAALATKYPDGLVRALVKVAKENTSKFISKKKLPKNIQALLFDYEVETHPKIWQRLEYLHKYAGATLPQEYYELKAKDI